MGRVNGYAATDGQRVGEDTGADDFAGRLVPEHKGAFGHEVAIFPVQVIVDIRAADAGGADAHECFLRTGLRLFDVGWAKVAGTV